VLGDGDILEMIEEEGSGLMKMQMGEKDWN